MTSGRRNAGRRGSRSGSAGRTAGAQVGARQFPRTARVNEVLREVLAEELEELAAADGRLELLTITGVKCDPDLRHATVLLASMPGPAKEALSEVRGRLQAAVARQVRLKRTPQLSFDVDPAITHGARVEEIIRAIHAAEAGSGSVPAETGDGGALDPDDGQ